MFINRSSLLNNAIAGGSGNENWGIGVHDIDGNGYLDIYLNHHLSSSEELIYNFTTPQQRVVNYERGADNHGVSFFDVDQDGDADMFQAVGGMQGGTLDPNNPRHWTLVQLNTGSAISADNSADLFGLEYPFARGRLCIPVNFDGQIGLYMAAKPREDGLTNSGDFFLRGEDGRYEIARPFGNLVSERFAKTVHLGSDDFTDVVSLNTTSKAVWVFENRGGGFNSGTRLRDNATDLVTGDFDGDLDSEILLGFHSGRERLYDQNSAGAWVDVGAGATLTRSVNISTLLTTGDFDNDGDLDYVALTREAGVALYVYLNQGNGTFAAGEHFIDRTVEGRGEYLVSGDFNRDGALDFLIGTSIPKEGPTPGEYVYLEGTPTGNRWLSIELEGVVSEKGGTGARVYVTTPDGKVQVREQDGGAHYGAQNSTDLHFGLADAQRADVTIVWPDGYRQTVTGVAANQHIVLTEDRSATPPQQNLIEGTARADVLRGTTGDDLIVGLQGSDRMEGRNGDDELRGGSGNDRLFGGNGADLLLGGSGADRLVGGSGVDVLTGGSDADLFVFNALGDSPREARTTITDFEPGLDRIDLSSIDAVVGTPVNDAFVFVGTAEFSGRAGELRLGNTLIALDADGDGVADMQVLMNNPGALSAGDFIL
ncbi:FG-GAP-like repeat-containing protein [Amaricoccus sp.]|uniref:FG-GAP-like repeat-containing protein n=1 Tax=Amaricoccus sp. TaxID=1872485 RepID=UPI0025C4892A|nr:FG-GAP-like repeat-containing protein [Amaricoccus sp.]